MGLMTRSITRISTVGLASLMALAATAVTAHQAVAQVIGTVY